jgi:hypothetical protein
MDSEDFNIRRNVDSSILAHVQFVVMLTVLQKLLNQELHCLCSKTTTVLWEWTVPKRVDVTLIYFIVLEINSVLWFGIAQSI